MKPASSAFWRVRWFTVLFVLALVASIAFGGLATRAQTTPTTAPTATPDNSVGSLNAPPPTSIPTATTAPTNTPPPATATPVGSAAAPASSPAAAPAGTTSGTPAAPSGDDDVSTEDGPDGGSPKNIVKVQNKTDNRLRVKAKIQLNRIPGDTAQPENYAQAYASCTNCQTFAVALQIDLISRTATTIAPQNAAIALNVKCSHCRTYANAIQYVVQVDDPREEPERVRELISQMQKELNAAAHTQGETADTAQYRIDQVIAQFNDLGQSLYRQHQENTDDDTPGSTVPPDAVALTPTPDSAPTGTTTPVTPTATP